MFKNLVSVGVLASCVLTTSACFTNKPSPLANKFNDAKKELIAHLKITEDLIAQGKLEFVGKDYDLGKIIPAIDAAEGAARKQMSGEMSTHIAEARMHLMMAMTHLMQYQSLAKSHRKSPYFSAEELTKLAARDYPAAVALQTVEKMTEAGNSKQAIDVQLGVLTKEPSLRKLPSAEKERMARQMALMVAARPVLRFSTAYPNVVVMTVWIALIDLGIPQFRSYGDLKSKVYGNATPIINLLALDLLTRSGSTVAPPTEAPLSYFQAKSLVPKEDEPIVHDGPLGLSIYYFEYISKLKKHLKISDA